MKKIEAIIRPERATTVCYALEELGCFGVTVYTASGHGIQGGLRQQWRGHECLVDQVPKVVVMAVVPEDDLREAVETIQAIAKTGRMGDGKVFITAVERALRVRTGETGQSALRPSKVAPSDDTATPGSQS